MDRHRVSTLFSVPLVHDHLLPSPRSYSPHFKSSLHRRLSFHLLGSHVQCPAHSLFPRRFSRLIDPIAFPFSVSINLLTTRISIDGFTALHHCGVSFHAGALSFLEGRFSTSDVTRALKTSSVTGRHFGRPGRRSCVVIAATTIAVRIRVRPVTPPTLPAHFRSIHTFIVRRGVVTASPHFYPTSVDDVFRVAASSSLSLSAPVDIFV